MIAYHKEVEEFENRHKNCVLNVKLTDDDKNTVVLTCNKHAEFLVASIPYRMFCRQLAACAGSTSCPRKRACSE